MNAKCFPFLFLMVVVRISEAQLQTFDYANSTVGSGGFVRFNNYAELGQTNANKLDYSDIRGTCFWDDEWNPAILVLKNGKGVKLRQVRLNFYTNNIHYVDNKGVELVAQNRLSQIIFFDRNDTTKLLAVFKGLAGFQLKGTDAYAQILVDGKVQFLKRTEVTLIKRDNDPMLGRPDLKFVSESLFYIQEDGKLFSMRTINKSNLFSIIKPTEKDEEWLKTNNNKLKNESDLIGFLIYRNSRKN